MCLSALGALKRRKMREQRRIGECVGCNDSVADLIEKIIDCGRKHSS